MRLCLALLAVGCGGRTSGRAEDTGAFSGSNAVSSSGAVTGSTVAGLTSGTAALGGSGGAEPTEAGTGWDGAADSAGSSGAVACGVAAAIVICTQDVVFHTWCLTNDPTSCPGSDPADGYICQNQCGPDQYGFSACGPFPDGGPTLDVPEGCTYVPTPTLPGYACCPRQPLPATRDAGADGSVTAVEIDAGNTPPSCVPGGPGMTNCGPGGSGTESCCTSLEVEGGTYERTYSYDIDMDAGWIDPDASGGVAPGLLADPATVSTFRLDKYDVTVGRFRPFVNAVLPPDGGAGWVPPPGSGKHMHLNGGRGLVDVSSDAGTAYEPGWIATDDGNVHPSDANLRLCNPPYTTWTASAGSQENLPINCVSWYDAYAFCIWDGGFLPSEAEWEYAAAGGEQQRMYPWVWGAVWNPSDPGTSNQYAIYGCYYPNGSGTCTDAANMAPVGTPPQGAGLWGQVDLAGEVWQWTMDWAAPYVSPCVDCAALTPTSSPFRVVRGDHFAFDASLLLATRRNDWNPSIRYFGTGFRCARTP